VTDGDQFTYDTRRYTLLDTTVAAFDIAIGADEDATKVNIVAAINASGTEGVEYHAGTTEHPTVVATAFAGDDMVVTAKVAGAAGDTIVSDETGQGLTDVANVFDDTTLGTTTAGVDNVDGSYIGIILAGGLVKALDTQNVYENTGTQANPEYTRIDTV
jgi:hypothetical protein